MRNYAFRLEYRTNIRHAFSLVEILVVIAIITILTSILLPIMMAARTNVQKTVCLSNLHQIGASVLMYTQDYDGYDPYAVDAVDRQFPYLWGSHPAFEAAIPDLLYVHKALYPYCRSAEVFHCSSDTGFDVEDILGLPFDAAPVYYERYGSSYFYHTDLAASEIAEAALEKPSETFLFSDACGDWHGSVGAHSKRYNVVFADQHSKSLSRDQFKRLWSNP